MSERAPDPVVVIAQGIPLRDRLTKARRAATIKRNRGSTLRFKAGEHPFGAAKVLAASFKPRRFLPPRELELVVEVVSAPADARRAMGLGSQSR